MDGAQTDLFAGVTTNNTDASAKAIPTVTSAIMTSSATQSTSEVSSEQYSQTQTVFVTQTRTQYAGSSSTPITTSTADVTINTTISLNPAYGLTGPVYGTNATIVFAVGSTNAKDLTTNENNLLLAVKPADSTNGTEAVFSSSSNSTVTTIPLTAVYGTNTTIVFAKGSSNGIPHNSSLTPLNVGSFAITNVTVATANVTSVCSSDAVAKRSDSPSLASRVSRNRRRVVPRLGHAGHV